MTLLSIGEAARAAGVTPKMLRHYERLGVVHPPDRSDGGHRLYGEHEVARFRFIRHARALGFSLKDIASLLESWGSDRVDQGLHAIVKRQLDLLEERQREIDEMRTALSDMLSRCHGGGRCAVLDEIARRPVVEAASIASGELKTVKPGSVRKPRVTGDGRDDGATPAEPLQAVLAAWGPGPDRSA